MTGALRAAGLLAGAAAVWLLVAMQVPSHARLPVSGVVRGAVLTQPFGCTSLALEPFDPFCPGHHVHTGIDLAAPTGTLVNSATSGTAQRGLDTGGAGLFVIVTVDSHVRLLYCHLSTYGVHDGEVVSPGEIIGRVGSTGMATGPHVHFEIQIDGRSVDPAAWLAS